MTSATWRILSLLYQISRFNVFGFEDSKRLKCDQSRRNPAGQRVYEFTAVSQTLEGPTGVHRCLTRFCCLVGGRRMRGVARAQCKSIGSNRSGYWVAVAIKRGRRVLRTTVRAPAPVNRVMGRSSGHHWRLESLCLDCSPHVSAKVDLVGRLQAVNSENAMPVSSAASAWRSLLGGVHHVLPRCGCSSRLDLSIHEGSDRQPRCLDAALTLLA